MGEVSNYSNREIPKIFLIFGKMMEYSNWLGYIFAFGAILFWGVGLAVGYEYFSFVDLSKGLISLGYFLFLSIGYINFAKLFGLALQQGRRSAVIGLIVVLSLISSLTAVFVLLETGKQNEPIIFWTNFVIFAVSTSSITLLIIALVIFWNNLKGGMKIY